MNRSRRLSARPGVRAAPDGRSNSQPLPDRAADLKRPGLPRRGRPGPQHLLALACLGALAALAIPLWIQARYAARIWTDVAQVPAAPVAIVFGGGIRPDGRLSPMLRDRVDRAVELYRTGKVR